ncbi:MAG TPA: PDZ domain-containing protein [Gemmatimonadales bacterium]|nr:PDZ domain-containing protein [Gemmatimonadales bacterium]
MSDTTQIPAADALAAVRSPRYIALLAGVALLVLLVGALLRPRDAKKTPAVPSNELVTLPELSQRKALRDMATYLAEQGEAAARSVVYLPALGASGLIWSRDSVLSVTSPIAFPSAHPAPGLLPALLPGAGDGAVPVTRSTRADSMPAQWGVVVARAPDGRPLTLAGLTGGRVAVRCGDATLETLAFNALLPVAFAGGGLFDVEGHLRAVAAACDGQVILVPLGEVQRTLVARRAPATQLWARYGVRFTPLDSTLHAALGRSGEDAGGLMVTEVWLEGPADRAGLRPGDVVTQAGDQPVTGLDDLAPLLASPPGTALRVRRTGGGVVLALGPDPAHSSAVALAPATPKPHGLALTHVAPGSRAARAGLRPGDRIVQVGRTRAASADAVHRALADSAATLVVYERDSRRLGAVLR